MRVAQVAFKGKEGLGKPYSYGCEDFPSELIKGDWIIVTSDRSKYNIGVFVGYKTIDDPDEIAVVTQQVAGTTALVEKGVWA